VSRGRPSDFQHTEIGCCASNPRPPGIRMTTVTTLANTLAAATHLAHELLENRG
jgi:hypothetical protein